MVTKKPDSLAALLTGRDQPSALTFMPMPPANTLASLLQGLDPVMKAPPPVMRTAQSNDMHLAKIKLNQLTYDRRLAAGAGIDVNGPDYGPVNAQIRMLRDMLKGAK